MTKQELQLQHFVEDLERYSRENDKGRAARTLQQLAEALFGATHRRGDGWVWEDPPDDVITSHQPTIEMSGLVPLTGAHDAAFVTSILEKTSLYSDFTAFVLPNRLSTWFTSYSAVDTIRVDDADAASRLLAPNLVHLDLVEAGRCAFLPMSSVHREETTSWHVRVAADAPLRQEVSTMTFQPTNLSKLRPVDRLADAFFAYKQLVLPFFPRADLRLLAEIAESETDAFRKFNRWLSQTLAHLPNAATSSDVQDVLGELDRGVEELAKEARRIATSRTLRDIDLGFFAVSLGVATQLPPDSAPVAGIVGSVTLLDLLRGWAERRGALEEMRRDTFYLPWLLRNAA